MECRTCGREAESEWRVCPYCETRLRRGCEQCGQKLQPDWQICPWCEHPASLSSSGFMNADKPVSKYRSRLEDKEKRTIHFHGLIQCAQEWYADWGETEAAARCLRSASKKLVTIRQRLILASAWLELCYADEAERVMETIPRFFKNIDLSLLKAKLADQRNDLQSARAALLSAEEKARSALEWQKIFEVWLALGIDDGSGATRCLESAEKYHRGRYEMFQDAFCWTRIGDAERARQKLIKCQEGDWDNELSLTIALEAWAELGDFEKARLSLEEIEHKALVDRAESQDWCLLAHLWMELGSSDSASRCLTYGEREADDALDYSALADGWIQVGNDEQATRSLRRAFELAGTTTELTSIAEHWQDLGCMEGVTKCLKRAEEIEFSLTDKIRIAEYWFRVGDEVAAKNCLLKAETGVTHLEEARQVAQAWDYIGGAE